MPGWLRAAVVVCCLGGSAAATAAPQDVRLGTIGPEGSAYDGACMGAFRGAVAKAAPDKLRVKVFLGAVMGDEQTMLAKVLEGKHLEIAGLTMATVATVAPELALFDLPFLFTDDASVDAAFTPEVRERIGQILARHGLELLAIGEAGWRNFVSRSRPIATPEDLVGLRVRSQPASIQLEMWRALGARPVPLAITEVMAALEVGHIEAFDIQPHFLFGASLHTQIRHFTRSSHAYQAALVVANRKTLSAPNLKLLADAWRKVERSCVAAARKEARQVDAELVRTGIAVAELSPAARAAFEQKLRPLRESFRRGTTPAGRALLSQVERSLARSRAAAQP